MELISFNQKKKTPDGISLPRIDGNYWTPQSMNSLQGIQLHQQSQQLQQQQHQHIQQQQQQQQHHHHHNVQHLNIPTMNSNFTNQHTLQHHFDISKNDDDDDVEDVIVDDEL